MSKNKQILMICLFLAIAILLVYWPVNNHDFFIFDDPNYITQNRQVQKGITTEGIQWAFTTGHVANWHPLTWISHMLDVQFFGMKARWHHLTNIFFHIANTLLLFFVLHRMTKALWESVFVAALFALHPLHVESVAWVAERKDVLSMFFWILTMGAYCLYVEKPEPRRYLVVALLFACGLMSKPMLVTLPFVLLLMDYWPLQRFRQMPSDQKISAAVSANAHKGKSKKRKKRRSAGEEVQVKMPAVPRHRWELVFSLVWEKIPLFILMVLSSIVTYIVQQKGGAVQPWPLGVRIANAFLSYIKYIGNMIWPADLAFLYPLPPSLPAWQVLGAVVLLIAITITVFWKAKRIPYAVVGWLWYVGTLVPVIGLVQVGVQTRADRYTYVPLIGLFIIVAWGVSELSRKWRYRTAVLSASSLVVLACLAIASSAQVRYWKDSITLFDHTLNVTENNYIIYNGRGTAYSNRGDYNRAIQDYNKVVEINPEYAVGYSNRASVYARLGNDAQANEDLKKAARLGYNYAQEQLRSKGIAW